MQTSPVCKKMAVARNRAPALVMFSRRRRGRSRTRQPVPAVGRRDRAETWLFADRAVVVPVDHVRTKHSALHGLEFPLTSSGIGWRAR